MDITQNNNNNKNRRCCIHSRKDRPCRIDDQISGATLPLHPIPGTYEFYLCEDHYLKDKIDRWWYKHPKPVNVPQFQEYPKCRIRPDQYFYFSKVEQQCIPYHYE
jgi:hypothetical protein